MVRWSTAPTRPAAAVEAHNQEDDRERRRQRRAVVAVREQGRKKEITQRAREEQPAGDEKQNRCNAAARHSWSLPAGGAIAGV